MSISVLGWDYDMCARMRSWWSTIDLGTVFTKSAKRRGCKLDRGSLQDQVVDSACFHQLCWIICLAAEVWVVKKLIVTCSQTRTIEKILSLRWKLASEKSRLLLLNSVESFFLLKMLLYCLPLSSVWQNGRYHLHVCIRYRSIVKELPKVLVKLFSIFSPLLVHRIVDQWKKAKSGGTTGWKIRGVAKRIEKENKNRQYQGFARSHLPYYWPGSSPFNFPDRTRGGAAELIWPSILKAWIDTIESASIRLFFTKHMLTHSDPYLSVG